MRVHGELLTAEDRKQINAHFCKNDGKMWDLHEMSLYVERGYKAIDEDAATAEMLKKGIERLRTRQKHE